MVQADDVLDLLLPDAGDAVIGNARRVVHFLRLLGDDARPARAASVGVDLDRARDELDVDVRRRLERALVDLLRLHGTAAAGPETFLSFGEPALELHAAWRILEEHRAAQPWLPGVPEPEERAIRVAARLLDALARLGLPAPELDLWRARLSRVSAGPRAAEKLFRAQLASAADPTRADPAAASLRRALVAGVAACLLDRAAVREARSWLQENGALVEGDPRLRQLLAWARLCQDDCAGARSLLVGLPIWSGPLPGALADLRARRPEWLPCLAGRIPSLGEPGSTGGTSRPGEDEDPVRDRTEIGACVLAVFLLDPGAEARAILVDAAPALRHGVRAWIADREGAPAVAGEREHDLVVGARAIVVHRADEGVFAAALGRETTRALALAPVLDEEGDVAGWLHIECEHHLLPSQAALSRMARAWRAEVLSRRHPEPQRSDACARSIPPGSGARVDAAREGCAQVFRDLVRDLGIKTAQRRWWGFTIEDGATRMLVAGGEGAGLSDEPTGRRRALARALSTGGTVAFEEPDARLAVDERSASGLVLPLRAGRSICGALAIESSRRRDFRAADVERHRHLLPRAGLSLRLAQFCAWHRETFGHEVWFQAAREDFRAFARLLLAAAPTEAPVVLSGPPGCGKQVLARWIHFERGAALGPLKVFGCSGGDPPRGIDALLAEAAGGSLLLDDVEDLAPMLQEELLLLLDGADGVRRSGIPDGDPLGARGSTPNRASRGAGARARILATTRIGLARAVEVGKLRHDLAHRLDRVQLQIPSLRERREDIPSLVDGLARRFAGEEGMRPPDFSDDAMALLWRQAWAGNVRELESFVYKLVLLGSRDAGSAVVEPDDVLELSARFSIEVVKRLPSRHPARSDLLAALRLTRKPCGRTNKTRAAAYLGWDPDTLVARMQDAGIDEETLDDETVWRSESAVATEDPE